jgi:fructosamine-3-kinase
LIEVFRGEASGLTQLRLTGSIRVPDLYCTGISGNRSFIAMQGIKIGAAQTHSYTLLGEQLAALHLHQSPTFGAEHNNHIGPTAQINTRSNNWFDFWREQRLGYQLQLAEQNGASARLVEDGYRLGARMQDLFDTEPAASCLHGDLWQGNWGFDQQGRPLIFDPAHYYGDREADIAMTRLFGAAQSDFYTAYQYHYPMSDNYRQRQIFYNIYHILNHYNLFGGRYLDQAQTMIQKLLADLG